MSDEEIDDLIAKLQAMLNRNGFGYAAEEAEDGLYATVGRRARALALIDAAEGVTVDLADMELRVLDRLEAEELVFAPDLDDEFGESVRAQGAGDVGDLESGGADRLRGPQRRAFVTELAASRGVFRDLRRRLDGED
jgi:hypothetical protein